MSKKQEQGFTFVEMVVSITITAIVICAAAALTTAPVDSYFTQTRRADLIVSGDTFAEKIQYDIEHALPNSVRVRNVGTRAVVEMLEVRAISFYAPPGSGGIANRELQLGAVDTKFHTVGLMFDVSTPRPIPLNNSYLVVGNTGVGTQNAYAANSKSRTPPGTSITFDSTTTAGEDEITIAPGFAFASTIAPRMFLVSGPVTYVCNSAAASRTIWRFSNYAIKPTIPANELAAQLTAAGVSTSVVSKDAAACAFTCEDPLQPTCKVLLTANVSISRATPNGAESLRVYRSLPLDNRL